MGSPEGESAEPQEVLIGHMWVVLKVLVFGLYLGDHFS